MLEWTGERFLPWHNDPGLAYEHLHRYFYAALFVRGKNVLDLASGEGYGANILAGTASRVVGIDIAPEAIEHARAKYTRPNLEFLTSSITNIAISDSHTFDVVVCFEAIEHIDDQDALLAEISRMLKQDGLLIASTPNKSIYDQMIQEENKFHVKELEFDEFRGLLQTKFAHVRFLGQRTYALSNLWPIGSESSSATEVLIDKKDTEYEAVPLGLRTPLYYVALASNSTGIAELQSSVLIDNSNALIGEKDRQIAERERDLRETKFAAAESETWLQQKVQERDEQIHWYQSEIKSRDATIAARDATIASHEEALAWRASQVDVLQKEKSDLISLVESTSQKLSRTTEQLEAVHASSGWKFVLRMRHYRDRLFPPGSLRGRILDRFIGAVARPQ